MANVKLFPCMIFDAICLLDLFDKDSPYQRPEQKAFREKINKLTSGKLYKGYIGMWGLCNKISEYDKSGKIENYTLDDLAEYFLKPEYIKEELLNHKIWVSNDDFSPEDWIDKYLNYINILKEIKFDKLWESDLMPVIQEVINNRQDKYNRYNFDCVFADIQKLKQSEPLEDIKIFISVMICPTAFKICGNSFVDNVISNNIDVNIGVLFHELMHGFAFANAELEGLYLEYINSINYLKKQHDILINELGSGNEEEFVVAAEYYLRMKHNNEDKVEILREDWKNDGRRCMPTSVLLFDLLSKENETPDGYAKWLIDVFKNKRLPQDAIEYHLDCIFKNNFRIGDA